MGRGAAPERPPIARQPDSASSLQSITAICGPLIGMLQAILDIGLPTMVQWHLKKKGEAELSGIATPNPYNQYWPEPTPFLLASRWLWS